MKRLVSTALVLLTILAIVAVAAVTGWKLRERVSTVYTDGDSIRQPAETAVVRDILWHEAERLPEPINSTINEYEPRVSPDGTLLLLVRGRDGEYADIYCATRDPENPDQWTEPQPLEAVNSPADDVGPVLARDGRSIYFSSNRGGGHGGYDLWISRLGEDGWEPASNLGPLVNSRSDDYGPSLAPDDGRLYFASNRPTPEDTEAPGPDAWPETFQQDLLERDFDLYACVLGEEGIEAAVPLTALNTPYHEAAPSCTPLGDFLYFASDRPAGFGGYDLYRSRIIKGALEQPSNLGPSINTFANELDPALSARGFVLHFSSDRGAGPRAGVTSSDDYDLYFAVSREVFSLSETYRAQIDWAQIITTIIPGLLWALVTLLLLLALVRVVRDARLRRLSLLGRCLLASAIAHMILLLGFTFWGVGTPLSDLWREGTGTRVVLTSTSVGSDLGHQVRSGWTEVPVAVPDQQDSPQPTSTEIQPRLLAAELDAAELQIEWREEPEMVADSQDAPPTPTDTPQLTEASPVEEQASLAVALPAQPDQVNRAEPRPQQADTSSQMTVRRSSEEVRQTDPQSTDFEHTVSDAEVAVALQPTIRTTRLPDAEDAAIRAPDLTPDETPTPALASAETVPIDTRIDRGSVATQRAEPSIQAPVAVEAAARAFAPSADEPDPVETRQIAMQPDPVTTATGALVDATVEAHEASPTLPSRQRESAAWQTGPAPELAGRLSIAVEPGAAAVASSEPTLETAETTAPVERSRATPVLASEMVDSVSMDVTSGPTDVAAGPLLHPAEASDATLPPAAAAAGVRAPGVQIAHVPAALPDPSTVQAAESHPERAAAPLPESPMARVPTGAMDQAIDPPATDARLDPAPMTPPEPATTLTTLQAPDAETTPARPAEATKMMPPIAPPPVVVTAAPESRQDQPARAVASAEPHELPAETSAPAARALDLPSETVASRPVELTPSAPPAGLPTKSLTHSAPARPSSEPLPSTDLDPLVDAGALAMLKPPPPPLPRLEEAESRPEDQPDAPRLAKLPPPREELAHRGMIPVQEPAAASDAVLEPLVLLDEVKLDRPLPVELEGADADQDDLAPMRTPDTLDPVRTPGGVLVELPLPTETTEAPNPYAQRSAQHRQRIVERMGGSEETEEAVTSALAWLVGHQSADGRWSSRHFDRDCGSCGGETSIKSDVALTGLSLLCFLAADHTHMKKGPYQETVERGLVWLMLQQGDNGSLLRDESMYSHGIASIALSEAYGMTGDKRLRTPVQKAIDFIDAARNRRIGGWRYSPGQPGDTSVLGWQVMALTSAKRAGLEVTDDPFDVARAWLDLVSTSSKPGLYAYRPGERYTPTMTAEGMFCQQLLGVDHDDDRMQESADLVLKNLPLWQNDANTYYWYYGTLALFQHQGDAWERWNRAMKRELLSNQRSGGTAAGSWDPDGRWAAIGGRVYQTAICTLTLEVYYRYLPLYVIQTPDGSPVRRAEVGLE